MGWVSSSLGNIQNIGRIKSKWLMTAKCIEESCRACPFAKRVDHVYHALNDLHWPTDKIEELISWALSCEVHASKCSCNWHWARRIAFASNPNCTRSGVPSWIGDLPSILLVWTCFIYVEKPCRRMQKTSHLFDCNSLQSLDTSNTRINWCESSAPGIQVQFATRVASKQWTQASS